MTTTLQIYASGNQYHSVNDVVPDLKELTVQATGKSFRRIGRFIQLALIGAARCTNLSVPPNTAVYVASGRGDLEMTIDIMTDLFARAQTPKPLAFVNTVSNAACFYVAQLLSLQSRSNYVCNRYFAFESIVQLAITDIHSGSVDSALIGSIDMATNPISDHQQRLKLPTNTIMGEGSHWLWLGKHDTERPRLGELIDTRHFANRNDLFEWCASHSFDSMALSCGQFVSDNDWTIIASQIKHDSEFSYRTERAYYDSQSGAAIGEFLRGDCPADTLLHINTDDSGRYSAMVVKR